MGLFIRGSLGRGSPDRRAMALGLRATLALGLRAKLALGPLAALALGLLAALALPTAPLAWAQPARGLELLMIEQDGCPWCAKWNAEIAEVYPKTDEGARAPLRRHDLHAGAPEGVTLDRPARFTPTFVLLADRREVGRIEGYPGEGFFWPMLAQLIERADAEFVAAR